MTHTTTEIRGSPRLPSALPRRRGASSPAAEPPSRPSVLSASLLTAAGLLVSCTGIVGATPGEPGYMAGAGGAGGPEGSGGGRTTLAAPVPPPAGIRRLTQREAQASVEVLLGVPGTSYGAALGTDTRQRGFTRNADQRVGSVQADALWVAVEGLAQAAVSGRLAQLAPCTTSGGSEACAKAFIGSFAAKAFRRALTAAEEAALLTVYATGKTQDGTYAAGIGLVITAVLQSPSFLYVTELGDAVVDGRTTLSGDEAATQLAYFLSGRPPSDAMVAQGRAGQLATPDGREAAARALLGTAEGHAQVQRFVLEWLGTDALESTWKDAVLFPEWPSLRADLLAQSNELIDGALFEADGTVRSLLLADSVWVTPALASYYVDTPGSGVVPFPAPRRGFLLTAGFLAANAQPASTAPVKRGAAVRKKLLCQELPVPTNLGVISVPPPDPTKTTRERFQAHSTSPACAGCHAQLDPIGFAMESFDPVGRYRTIENGKSVDTSGELTNAGDATGPFANGVELAERLAAASIVRECLPRQVFRFASGRSGGDEEETFFEFVRDRPSALDGKVVELLVDWARSDSFMTRSVQ